MNSQGPQFVASVVSAVDCISRISQCKTEADVQQIVELIAWQFGFNNYGFVTVIENGIRKHYRCLLGCSPKIFYCYLHDKMHAIDPLVRYAFMNSDPKLFSDISGENWGHRQSEAGNGEDGFRNGILVPAHGAASTFVGLLCLGTDGNEDEARIKLKGSKHLMRALALELLEWWSVRLRLIGAIEFRLDPLDLELLRKAHAASTAKEAALELGITVSLAKSRYEKLIKKMKVACKRSAVEKALQLGLIQ